MKLQQDVRMTAHIDFTVFCQVFQKWDEDLERHRILEYALVFVGLGAFMLITMFLQVSCEKVLS